MSQALIGLAQKRRYFGGELFPTKENRAFEKKHLKSYIRGDRQFQWGWKMMPNGLREPRMFEVKAIWK